MRTVREVFGYQGSKLGDYRDLALACIASFAFLWALAGLSTPHSDFDFKLGLGSLLVALACVLLSRRKVVVAGGALAFVVIRGLVGFFLGGKFLGLVVAAGAAVLFLGVMKWNSRVQRSAQAKRTNGGPE